MNVRSAILLVVGLGIATSVILPIGLVAHRVDKIRASAVQSGGQAISAHVGKDLEVIAISVRNALDSQMRAKYEMVRSWASMPSVVQVARTAQSKSTEELFERWSAAQHRTFLPSGEAKGDGDPENDLSPDVSRVLVHLAKTTACIEVAVIDARGYVVAASGATTDFDQGGNDYRFFRDRGLVQGNQEFGGEAWFRATARSTTGFYVGSVRWDESASAWGTDVSVTINEPNNGRYLGQLKVLVDYGAVTATLLDTQGTELYEIKLVDQVGTVVATSRTDKLKVNSRETSIGKQRFFEQVQQRRLSGYEVDSSLDENGTPVYLGFAVSADVNRYVVVVTRAKANVDGAERRSLAPLDAAIAAASRTLLRDLVFGGLTCFVVFLLVTIAVLNRRLSMPLAKLNRYLRRLAKGDVEGLRVEVSGEDEVGELGAHLKAIHEALQSFDVKLIASGMPAPPPTTSKKPPR